MKNLSLAKALAKKQYYASLKIIIEKRLKALYYLEGNYPETKLSDIYDKMCVERKMLVKSIEPSVDEIVKQWEAEE